MEFVVIGADAAGMSAASRAKRNRPDLNVTVLEKSLDVSYSACGMPYNIADVNRDIEDLVVRKADAFRTKQGINLLTGHCAENINRKDKTVSGIDQNNKPFTVPYDNLLIATGASAIIPDLPGIDLPGVMTLRGLDDGRKLKEYLNSFKVSKVVIIGMGYIALEMCEALRARNIEVEAVDLAPEVLPWLEPQLSDIVKSELRTNGIDFNTGVAVERIEMSERKNAPNKLKVICSDLTLEGEMVLVAIGATPNSEIASKAGLDLGIGNSIAVGKNLLTSDDHIYAAGDCADAFHVVTGQKTYIPLALRANRSGWAVADNVCGGNIELPGIVGTSVFKIFDLEVASTGMRSEEAFKYGFEPRTVIIETRSRAHAHPGNSTLYIQMTADFKTGRLLGVQMVGREGVAHRINAIAVALHAGMTVEQFKQTDLAYAPPFGPVWDPLLTTANQMVKKLA